MSATIIILLNFIVKKIKRDISIMSMSSTHFECDTCDFTSTSRVLWGKYNYLVDGCTFPIDRQLGYCNGCNSIAPIEKIISVNETLKKLIQVQENLQQYRRSTFTTLWNNCFSFKFKEYKKQEKALSIYYKISTERSGTEKCLMCGNEDFILLDKPVTGVELVKLKAKKDVFSHPGCGGHLLAKEDPLRLNCTFSPLLYSFGGLKLKPDEE
jgi:predicted nucleic-acid-binding Zn-ribbon protein